MKIPHQQLSPDAIHAIVEEFVTRSGTDYGEHEFSLEQKVQQVMRQLESKDVVVVFDPVTETCSILAAADAQDFD